MIKEINLNFYISHCDSEQNSLHNNQADGRESLKKIFALVLCELFCAGSMNVVADTAEKSVNQIIELGENHRLILSKKPGSILKEREFKVFQVLSGDGAALADINRDGGICFDLSNRVLLLYEGSGELHYDGEVIKIPAGKCA